MTAPDETRLRTACPVCDPVIEYDRSYAAMVDGARVEVGFRVSGCCDAHQDVMYDHFKRTLLAPRINVPNVEREWSPYPIEVPPPGEIIAHELAVEVDSGTIPLADPARALSA